MGVDGRDAAGPDQHVEAKRWFRGDINGLRALAIVPVVAFHASIPGFAGGFTGVDVFFVISGYLITTRLLDRAKSQGGIRLREFWANRLRRLTPALVLMLVVTLAIAIPVLSPLFWSSVGRQALAAALYVSNLLFAHETRSYFATDVADSPFLHTWTLGVEEQFYLLWPLLILVAIFVARNRRWPLPPVLVALFAATFAASFALALDESMRRAVAFYILPTRAWEFAAGGLIAALPIARWMAGRVVLGNIAVLVGISALMYGTITLSAMDRFPGTAALIPVLGSALIILGGSAFAGSEKAQPAMSRILAVRPLQWIGTMSYSWYLWHWPFIILAMVMFDTDALWLQVAAGAAALAAAALTYYKVENPLRYSARLRTSVKRTFVVTGTALAAAALLGSATLAVGIHLERTSLRHLATVRAAVPGDNLCPENVQMSPKKIQYCVYGDTESARTVFLVGDSHAGQWRDALAAAAKDEGIMLVTRWKASCPAVPARVALEGGSGPDAACAKYQAKSFALMKELQPNGVVVAQAAFYDVRVRDEQGMQPTSEEGRLNIWLTAYRQFIDRVSETGAAVAVIEDNPEMRRDPLRCLARFGNSESDCAPTRGEALETVSAIQAAEANILQRPEIKDVFGTIDKICDATRCRLLDGDTIIFRDTDHLSREWTLNQQARLEELLASIS